MYPDTGCLDAAKNYVQKKFTIGKTERLKSRKKIDELFRGGRRFNAGPFRVSFAIEAGAAVMQFGTGAGTRNFKRAHDRNRIKRLCRENWRLANQPLKELMLQRQLSLFVFVLYTGKELPDYTFTRSHFTRITDNLLRACNETITPDT